MKTTIRASLLALITFLILCPETYGQFASTGTTTLSVTVIPEAALQVTTTTTSLSTTGNIFNPYTGTTNLIYKIRTTQSTGTGAITLKVTADFSPANGPSVSSPPTAGDALTYTCVVSAPGTACSGSQTASTSDTNVATFGGGAHSAIGGNSASTTWSLTNDPAYRTGAYSATVTYTISTT